MSHTKRSYCRLEVSVYIYKYINFRACGHQMRLLHWQHLLTEQILSMFSASSALSATSIQLPLCAPVFFSKYVRLLNTPQAYQYYFSLTTNQNREGGGTCQCEFHTGSCQVWNKPRKGHHPDAALSPFSSSLPTACLHTCIQTLLQEGFSIPMSRSAANVTFCCH